MSVKDLKAAVDDLLLGRNGSKLSTADREAISKALDALHPSGEWARYAAEQVEERWLDRVKIQEFGKPTGLRYKRLEMEFFMGAMSMANALLPNDMPEQLTPYVPTRWIIRAMSGRNICG